MSNTCTQNGPEKSASRDKSLVILRVVLKIHFYWPDTALHTYLQCYNYFTSQTTIVCQLKILIHVILNEIHIIFVSRAFSDLSRTIPVIRRVSGIRHILVVSLPTQN